MTPHKEKMIELIRETISNFEHIRKYRKVKYLDTDFHVADATMKYVFAEILSQNEIAIAEAMLNTSIESSINSENSENSMTAFCEYCNTAIANLRICEVKLKHFSSDSPTLEERLITDVETENKENQPRENSDASSPKASKTSRLKKRIQEAIDSKIRVIGITIDLKKLFGRAN